MKKILVALMATAMLMAGCAPKTPAASTPAPAASTPAPAASTPAPAATKIGTASIVNVKGANYNTADKKDGTAQSDVTMCTVMLDDAGKITYVNFDVTQSKFAFNDKGELTTDLTKGVISKKELGANYGMAKVSEIKKEWFEQIAAYEQWLIGKTVDEAVAMKTFEKDASHKEVPDVAELKTSVTIDIGGYRNALVKAAANAK